MTGHIFLEGEIGADVTTKTVRADIANYPNATEWMVHINSGGGDVYEGYQIGTILKNLKNTTAHIGSMCASIATYDALSCQHVVMSPHGDFMIHLPTATIGGNADELRKGAAQLDRIKGELISQYAPRVARKGVDQAKLSGMIDNETSMSPQEALQLGFIDEIQEKIKAVAKFDPKKYTDMETLTKEEAQGFFKSFGDKLDKFMAKFKNSVQVAMADGTMATSDAASIDALVGSSVAGADGAPLADGEYETADGYAITVAGGKVATYEPLMADKVDPAKENAALKQQVADLTAKLTAQASETQQVAQAKAKQEKEFSNVVKEIKDELETLKSKTFGDATPPAKDTAFKAEKKEGEQKQRDPMDVLLDAFKTSRPGGMA